VQEKATIKVSENTLKMLKEEDNFSSMDETIIYLIKLYREEKLRRVFGIEFGLHRN
jgi:hypothetical protein